MRTSPINEKKVHTFLDGLFGVRFRQCITVTTDRGERRPAAEWIPSSGQAVRLKVARVTDDEAPVGAGGAREAEGHEGALVSGHQQ